MPVPLVPPSAALPAELLPVLKALHDAVQALQHPQEPTPAFPVLEADLPPAASYPNTVVYVTDLSTLAFSDGAGWIRADDGTAI